MTQEHISIHPLTALTAHLPSGGLMKTHRMLKCDAARNGYTSKNLVDIHGNPNWEVRMEL